MTRVHTGRCCCAEKPRRGVDNKAFFFHLLTVGPPCQSTLLRISPRWRVGWPTHPGNERSALPTLSPVSTFHIQYYTNAEPLHSHHISPPRCLLQLPLDSSFFCLRFFFTPTAQNVARSSSQQDRKRLSRRVASAFLALWYTVNAGRSGRGGEKDGRGGRGRGGVTQTCRTNTGI